MEKLKLSVTDIQVITGESRSNVVRAMYCGDLVSFIVGRRRFSRPQAVRDWVDFLEKKSNQGKPVSYQSRASERPKLQRETA